MGGACIGVLVRSGSILHGEQLKTHQHIHFVADVGAFGGGGGLKPGVVIMLDGAAPCA